MKKISLILIFALLLSFCACEKDEPLVLDVDSTAERIVSELTFYEDLFALDEEMARSLLLLDEDAEAKIAMYVGSGASADCVIVAKGDILPIVETYLDEQEQMYASYMIDEAAKIKNAVLGSKDDYIIVVVTEDEDASKLVDEIMK